MLTTGIFVGTRLVIVVATPDSVLVNVVGTYSVDTNVVGTRTVLKEINVWVKVGPWIVVRIVVGKSSVVVRVISVEINEVM